MAKNYSWFGIDFGTTNSAACSFTGTNQNTIVPIFYGDDEQRPFPSVIAVNKKTGEIITGRDAKSRRNQLLGEYEYFSSIKSIIDSSNTWEIAGKTWTPEDVAAEILRAIKKRVEKGTSVTLSEAVMAVPNGFTAAKKAHLRNAAKKAGIDVKMFISEPTAAFCSNYNELKSCKNVAVFDWGGGTLDVTVLKVENGEVSEMASSGMMFAGDDIDRKFAQKIHARFMRGKTPSISFDQLDPITKDKLLTQCERAKCDFEDEDVVSISILKYGSYGPVRDSVDYDYLVIDEGQDLLLCDVIDVLGYFISGGIEKGKWIMFLDPNQNIFNRSDEYDFAWSYLREIANPAIKTLNYNCRNTEQIALRTAALTLIPPAKKLKIPGPNVKKIIYSSRNDFISQFKKQVTSLLSGGISSKEIVILSRYKLGNSMLAGIASVCNLTIVECDNLLTKKNNTLNYFTIQSYKGLEASVVLLIDIDGFGSDTNRLLNYVAMSRAKAFLYMFFSEDFEDEYDDTLDKGREMIGK